MIFLGIVLLLDGYLSRFLAYPLFASNQAAFWTALILFQIIFGSMLWLFFVFFKSEAECDIRFEEHLRDLAFLSMGVLSFLVVLSLIRDLIALVTLPLHFNLYSPQISFAIFLLTALSVCIGAWIARYRIASPRIEIPIAGLPKGLNGLKIAQLSDMHLGTGPKTAQIGKMIDRALSFSPDLIVLTGDIIDGNIRELTPELEQLGRLKAPHGVYYVLGNHECYWNHLDAISRMKELGFKTLLNEGTSFNFHGESVFVAGMTDPAILHGTIPSPEMAPKVPTPPEHSHFNLALVHQPHFAKKIAEFPAYHLQLSGHTHGGQFFPWNFAVRRVHQFHSGLNRLKNLFIYVNAGSGYWGPPLRLGTECEVTLLVITSA